MKNNFYKRGSCCSGCLFVIVAMAVAALFFIFASLDIEWLGCFPPE